MDSEVIEHFARVFVQAVLHPDPRGRQVTSLIARKAKINPLIPNPRYAQGETQLNRKAWTTSCQFNQSLMGTISQAAEPSRCHKPLSRHQREMCVGRIEGSEWGLLTGMACSFVFCFENGLTSTLVASSCHTSPSATTSPAENSHVECLDNILWTQPYVDPMGSNHVI